VIDEAAVGGWRARTRSARPAQGDPRVVAEPGDPVLWGANHRWEGLGGLGSLRRPPGLAESPPGATPGVRARSDSSAAGGKRLRWGGGTPAPPLASARRSGSPDPSRRASGRAVPVPKCGCRAKTGRPCGWRPCSMGRRGHKRSDAETWRCGGRSPTSRAQGRRRPDRQPPSPPRRVPNRSRPGNAEKQRALAVFLQEAGPVG